MKATYFLDFVLWIAAAFTVVFSRVTSNKRNDSMECSKTINHYWQYTDGNNYTVRCSFGEDRKTRTISRVKNNTLVNRAKILLGNCVTANSPNEVISVAPCPYDTSKGHTLLCPNNLLLPDTSEGLTAFMCSGLNRHGNYCKDCNESYGQSVFTMDLSCYSCNRSYSGWALYLFFETTFLGIFLVVIILFQISPAKGSTKAFVLFSQLNMVYLSFGTEPMFLYPFKNRGATYLKLIKVFYGIWNLDFFRSVIPPFCVSPRLNNLEVLMLHYIPIIIPSILVAIAWIIVDLHERGFRPLVVFWRPFRRALSHYSVTNDPKRSIINFFATLVILSSTKIMFIALTTTTTYGAHHCCDNDTTPVLYVQPDIKVYHSAHIVYFGISLTMVTIYVFFPVFLLIIYSLQSFQDKLNKYCIRSHNIQIFAEAFYTPFKASSDWKKDCRLFSTMYFFFRALVLICFLKAPMQFRFLFIAIAHGALFGIICLFRPYKNLAHTFLDVSFVFLFFVGSFFATGIAFASTSCETSPFNQFLYVSYYIVLAIPIIYALIRVIRYIVKGLEFVNFKSILNWRRRGYVEIGPYEADESVVVDRSRSTPHVKKDEG